MFNPEDYRQAKPAAIKYFRKNGVTPRSLSEYCSLTMVPIVAICTFIMEEFPEHEEFCRRKIREVREFYGS